MMTSSKDGPIVSLTFKPNTILQEYVNLIYNEGREEDLIKACDYYHHAFPDMQSAFEWGLTFGQYVGKNYNGIDVYRFTVLHGDLVFYFIGAGNVVSDKLNRIL